MSKNKTISVLGCGWLGLPLAEKMVQKGFQVKGSTTTPEKMQQLQDKGIRPFLVRLEPEVNQDFNPTFFECDTLILNIPPSRKRPDIDNFYPAQIDEVLRLSEKSGLKKILFVSSTSVYPNLNREVGEEDAGGEISKSGQALLHAEEMLRSQAHIKVSVLRFCGLYDTHRNPGRFLAGRKLQSNGKDRVNLIHLEDCINIILRILEKGAWGETFNACADEHPEKEAFYTLAAKKLGIEPPSFDPEAASAYKTINSDNLKKRLEFSFLHPDPFESVKKQ